MGQVTIYLDPDTERKLTDMVKKSGLSKSRWISDLIKSKTTNIWPDSIVELSGAWKDLPTAEEIREGMGDDIERAPI